MNRGIYGELNFLKKIFMTEFVKTRLTTIEVTWIVAGWDKFHFACVKLDNFNSFPELFSISYDEKIKKYFLFFFLFLDFSFLRHIDFFFIFFISLLLPPCSWIFIKKTSHGKYPETFSVFSSYISLWREMRSLGVCKKK